MKRPGGRGQRARRARKEPRRGAKDHRTRKYPSGGAKDAQNARKRVAGATSAQDTLRAPAEGGTRGAPAEDGTRGAPAEGGTRGAPAEEHRHSRLPAGRSCSRADASPQKPIPGSIFRLFHVKQCRSRASSTYTHNPKQESNCTPISQPAPCKKECAMEIAVPAGFSARPVRVFRVLRRMRAPWRVPRA